MTILLVEQYLDFRRQIADDIYIMDRGEIMHAGPASDLDRIEVRKHLMVQDHAVIIPPTRGVIPAKAGTSVGGEVGGYRTQSRATPGPSLSADCISGKRRFPLSRE